MFHCHHGHFTQQNRLHLGKGYFGGNNFLDLNNKFFRFMWLSWVEIQIWTLQACLYWRSYHPQIPGVYSLPWKKVIKIAMQPKLFGTNLVMPSKTLYMFIEKNNKWKKEILNQFCDKSLDNNTSKITEIVNIRFKYYEINFKNTRCSFLI